MMILLSHSHQAGKKGVCSHNDDSDDHDNDIVILPYQQNVYSQ